MACREKETVLCDTYKLDSIQNRIDIQLACTMFRLSKTDLYIDHSIYCENLRSEDKIKFNCPFTRVAKIRKSPFYRGVDLWNSLKVKQHRAENKKICSEIPPDCPYCYSTTYWM